MKTQLLILFLSFFISARLYQADAQGVWTQKADLGGIARWGAVGFSIGNKGYIGTGINGANNVVASHLRDFWEWDQATNVWTQKADFGGGLRQAAVGFSIGNKGYIGTGVLTLTLYQDFWEWDQATNVWIQKANLPGSVRWFAEGFSVGNKGYIGLGTGVGGPKQDFWEWDQATNVWIQKANLAGPQRYAAIGFSIGSKGYLGIGWNGIYLQDFWEWDQATNVWTQKAAYAGTGSQDAVGFSIGTKGYIGTGRDAGCVRDFWEWDQATNVWVQMADFGASAGHARQVAVGFSIGTCGYIGTGWTVGAGLTRDFWEWSKGGSCSSSMNVSVTGTTVCTGNCVTLIANPNGGTAPYTYSWNPAGLSGQTIIVCPTLATTYTVIITDSNNSTSYDTALVTVNQPPLASIAGNTTICTGNTATLIAAGGGTYSWNTGATTQTINSAPSTTSSYSVVVTNGGCKDTAFITVNVIPGITAVVTAPATICMGDSIVFTASGGNTYAWSNGATENSITASTSGTYSVVVSAGNCSGTAITALTVNPKPLANAGASVNIIAGNSASLNASGGITYNWSPTIGLSCSTCQNPIATPSTTTEYCVTVTDVNGCTDSACVTVYVETPCLELSLPNAFSPNSDGENDRFCLQGGGDFCILELTINIYDRWGEKVYESTEKNFCWDAVPAGRQGTYGDKSLNSAVFVYYLNSTLVNGKKINKKGNISLIK